MKINDYNIKKKALEPLIATILLIVVSVILVTIVLTWGKEFSTSSLNKTNNFAELKASDATHFIYPKSAVDGVMQFTYSPPAEIKQDINVTHYRVINIPEMTEPIALSEPKILSPSLNILELPCLYEYSTTTPDLYIQLITADNTYIDIKTKDAGMVCSSGGTGTEEDPIVICNAEDLNNVRNDLDANYALGKDIDLQCFSRQDVNGWLPIGTSGGAFVGGFNGQNHKIKNMYINRNTQYMSLGLFGWMSKGYIKNLGLLDVNVSSTQGYIGGLVGEISGGLIENNYTTGEVRGNYAIGGLIGGSYEYPEPVLIKNNYSEANVYGNYQTGGLIGDHSGGTIENCYSKGMITRKQGSNYGTVAGFCGGLNDIIKNSYSIGKVIYEGTTNPTNKGFSGEDLGTSGINNFWDIDASEQATSPTGATGKTTTEMKTQSTFTDWDFSSIWAINSSINDGYPYLRNNPPR